MSAILSSDDLNDFITPGVACIKPIETLPTADPDANGNGLESEVIRDGVQANNASSNPAQISLTDCLACSGCVTSAEAVLVSLQSHAEVLRALDQPGMDVGGLLHRDNDQRNGLHTNGNDLNGHLDGQPEKTNGQTNGHTNGHTNGNSNGNAHQTNDSTPSDDSEEGYLFVASVSPQTRANLAAAVGPGVTATQAGNMLEHLLRGPAGLRSGGANHNAFTWVVDTSAAREMALVLGADEVLAPGSRHAAKTCDKSKCTGACKSKPKPTTPDAAAKTPILSSSCPGWVCYAEKTHPHVLTHLSRVKSPQALTGTLLKTTLSRRLGIRPDRIWHVAIMPCFDKKLEASREELTDAIWGPSSSTNSSSRPAVRDVDCVITSKEVLMLAESRGIDFFGLPKTKPKVTRLPFPDPTLDHFLFPERPRIAPPLAAGTSGGNLYFVLQSVLAQNPGATLHTTRGRNVDVVEYTITAAPNPHDTPESPSQPQKTIFKAARYYGFRNIQNLVRRLKPARPSRLPGGRPVGTTRRPTGAGGAGKAGSGVDFSYLEVMACPGGCTNGGGQIKVDDAAVTERRGGVVIKPGPAEQKAWLAEIDEAYFSAEDDEEEQHEQKVEKETDSCMAADAIDGISPSYVRATLAHWSKITSIDVQQLAYTSFREVQSDVGGKTATPERVVQLAGKIGGGW